MKSFQQKSRNCLRKHCSILLFFLLFQLPVYAQQSSLFSASANRILFVLDASGSMKGALRSNNPAATKQSKFDLSRQLLVHTIDSISKIKPNVEFAVRVFGHQSPRSVYNCKDTKLEIPFAKNNGAAIAKRLQEIEPKGQTPIEFTLAECIGDFPKDSLSNNSIILITDGNETCNGNICNVAELLQQQGIVLKPYIIGLGLTDSMKKKFECAGAFFDVQRDDLFSGVLRAVVSRALNATTAQVNLLDAYGLPSETNVELTFYDHLSGSVKYRFIHTLNGKGNPDTLCLDPSVIYDLQIHSTPAVFKNEIELVQGIHNTIAADVPQGTLELKWETTATNNAGAPCLVRAAADPKIFAVQDINRSQKYLVGNYDLEILTLPRIIMKQVLIEQSKTTALKIPRPGTLSVSPQSTGVASVMVQEGNNLRKIWDFNQIASVKTLALQPGSYIVVFRPEKGRQSSKTKEYPIKIITGKTTSLKL
ncbi:MAG: VWA domain-containing protein [Chitinophagales bacterium]|nr:VWA domain-containing protein [Chitinophagales bacterium]